MPCRPVIAAAISHSSVSSSAVLATSRMSSSSSITRTRLCRTFVLHFCCDLAEQPDHVFFEFIERGPALGEELRRAEAQLFLLRGGYFERGVDDERDVGERAVSLQPVD